LPRGHPIDGRQAAVIDSGQWPRPVLFVLQQTDPVEHQASTGEGRFPSETQFVMGLGLNGHRKADGTQAQGPEHYSGPCTVPLRRTHHQ
jgi:hypothetical protein